MKKIAFIVALFILSFGGVASAQLTIADISTPYTQTTFPEIIQESYQDYIVPKFPANESADSEYNSHFQVYHLDDNVYNFLYMDITRVRAPFTHIDAYKVEITYQTAETRHDDFLTDLALPGDHVYMIYANYVTYNLAQIIDIKPDGTTRWNHTSSSWAWVGAQPDQYLTPQWFYQVSLTTGHNCLGDMPAQDTAGGMIHLSHTTVLSFILLRSGIWYNLFANNLSSHVTTTTPTDCGFVSGGVECTSGGTVFTCNTITTYGGG